MPLISKSTAFHSRSVEALIGGDAIFSGGSYQASVIAYVFVHILAQRQLGWLGTVDDTPSAV